MSGTHFGEESNRPVSSTTCLNTAAHRSSSLVKQQDQEISERGVQKLTCRYYLPHDGGLPLLLVCRKAAPPGGLDRLLLWGVSWCNSTICHGEYSGRGLPILATCRGMTDECGGGGAHVPLSEWACVTSSQTEL